MRTAIAGGEFEELSAADALVRATEGVGLARAAGFTAEPRSEISPVTWEGILDVADEVDAAVIVIGSHGLTGIRERFEGSVSHQVAEDSGQPVLIVPPPRERR